VTDYAINGAPAAASVAAADITDATAVGIDLLTAANAAAARDAVGVAASSSGLDAARPAAGTAGRTYAATDTGAVYLDTGSAWVVASNGGANDRTGLTGFSGTIKVTNATATAPGVVKGATIAAAFNFPTLPGATQQCLWSANGGPDSRGFVLSVSGGGAVADNAIRFVTLGGSVVVAQIGSALAIGPHAVAITLAADGLSLSYSIDGAAAVTGVAIAASTQAPITAGDIISVGGVYTGPSANPATTVEIYQCVHVSTEATGAQLAAMTAGYAEGRITTPAALTEDWAWRAALIPGYGAVGPHFATGSTRLAMAVAGAPTAVMR
jgi:hypothetical protein